MPLRRAGQVVDGTLPGVCMGGLGLGQGLLDRRARGDRLRQCPTQFRLAHRQPLGRSRDFQLPVQAGLRERGNRIGQLLFDGCGLFDPRLVLRLGFGKSRGQGRQLRSVLPRRIMTRVVGGSEALFERRAVADFSIESILERRVPICRRGQVRHGTMVRLLKCSLSLGQSRLDRRAGRGRLCHRVAQLLLTPRQAFGGRGQVRFGALLRDMMCGLGLGQSVLDRRAGRDCFCQRSTQFHLARRQPLGRGGHFQLPIVPGLLERRSGITQLPFE